MGINERTRLKDDSVPRNLCPATTRMEKGLLVIVLLVVAVGIGLTIALVAYYRGDQYDVTHPSLEKFSPSYCLTVSCITTAADIISSMDETKKPCEDFYKYVCGNWIKRSPMVGSLTSQFTKLNRLTTMRLKEILEELQKTSELEEHHSKAKSFYSACMEIEADNTKDLLSDLQSFGRWPVIDNKWNSKQFDWVDLMGSFKKSGYIYDMLLTIFVRPDVKNTSSTLIAIYPPTLGTDLSYFTMDELLTTYQDGIIHIAKSLAPDLNETIAETEITAAYQIERRLANVSIETMKKGNPDIYYNIRTIKELENFAPKIPWLKLLRKLLAPDANITRNERVMVAKPEAIRTLNAILDELSDEKGKRVLANYMFYRSVVFVAKHVSSSLSSIHDKMQSTSSKSAHWQYCLQMTVDYFGLSLIGLYAQRYLDKDTKLFVEEMVGDLKNSLIEKIEKSQWMDGKTKERAIEKVLKKKFTVGYNEEMENEKALNKFYAPIEIGTNHFKNFKAVNAFKMQRTLEGLHKIHERHKWTDITNLLAANAFYHPSENSIVIPLGLLQDSIISSGKPGYVNYGGFGAVIGHEFAHAFDSIGSHFDGEGNYRMWFTNASWQKFEEKQQCFVKQYDDFYEPRVDTHVNGTMTLSENMADSGGLEIAHEAYQKFQDRIKRDKILPGLNFTEDQLFWISYASIWCRKQSDTSLYTTMHESVHAPPAFRVSGAVANTKAFSVAFKCEMGTIYHPPNRCSMWE